MGELMDSINDKKIADPFPFESLHQLRSAASPEIPTQSDYVLKSFDNRSRFSDMAQALRSKLGYFKVRVSSSAFLSDAFTWQVNTATSSDPDRLLSRAASFASRVDYSFEVDRLASGQQAKSDKLVSRDASDFETGTYSYTLTVNDTDHDIDVEIDNAIGAPATNKTVLLAVERSINRLGLSVEASIETSNRPGYNPYRDGHLVQMSQLKIASTSTGTQTSFALADTSGDLIETLGLNQTVSFGSKNQYRVNGSSESADLNQVDYASGKARAYLLGTSDDDENLRISINKDRQQLFQELSGVIEDYNELIQWIDENENIISPSLKKELFGDLSGSAGKNNSVIHPDNGNGNTQATQSSDFASTINQGQSFVIDHKLLDIGLALNSDGTIEIRGEFENSLSSDLQGVHKILAGTDGFFTDISNAIDRIHGKKEDNYIVPLNSIMAYDSEGSGRRSIYQSSSGNIISFFA